MAWSMVGEQDNAVMICFTLQTKNYYFKMTRTFQKNVTRTRKYIKKYQTILFIFSHNKNFPRNQNQSSDFDYIVPQREIGVKFRGIM